MTNLFNLCEVEFKIHWKPTTFSWIKIPVLYTKSNQGGVEKYWDDIPF